MTIDTILYTVWSWCVEHWAMWPFFIISWPFFQYRNKWRRFCYQTTDVSVNWRPIFNHPKLAETQINTGVASLLG